MSDLKGKTALITGASSGIGEAISRELASHGTHLVLVARNRDKLAQLTEELTLHHGIRCTPLIADLGKPNCGALLYQKTSSMGINVDILVNNAGFGTYGSFASISPEVEQAEIAVNIAAVVDLVHAYLPEMLARGAGTILNVASTAAFQPVPYMAVYGATKSFVLNFSEALWAEYRGQGIHVTTLCPGAVETNFISQLKNESVRKTAAFATTIHPERVAAAAVKAIRSNGSTHIIGMKNWLMVQLVRFVPRKVVARSGADMMRPPMTTPKTPI